MTTPRQFRNAIYQHLTEANVDNHKAVAIAEEAELYAEAYEAFQLRGIEGAAEALKVKQSADGLTSGGEM